MAAAAHYYDRVNPDLLQRIPVIARAVLEVGCGAGALGAAFKAIRPEVVYVGLEQVEAAAKVASGPNVQHWPGWWMCASCSRCAASPASPRSRPG